MAEVTITGRSTGNNPDAVIYGKQREGRPQPLRTVLNEQQTPAVPSKGVVNNGDTFIPAPAFGARAENRKPVSNEGGQIIGGGARGGAISNPDTVVYARNPNTLPVAQIVMQNPDARIAPGTGGAITNPDTVIFRSATPAQPSVRSNPDAQILPGRGAPMQTSNDVTMGGGGNMVRDARHEEVHFGGKSTMDIGSRNVTMAKSLDSHKRAGEEDVKFAKTGDTISPGGIDTHMAETNQPVNNSDFQETGFGARGKPIKSR